MRAYAAEGLVTYPINDITSLTVTPKPAIILQSPPKGGPAVSTIVDPSNANRPYAPPSNVIAVLHRLRSRNLPERVDDDYLRDANIPDGSISRTLFALRFLGLLDGEMPAESLRQIAVSTDEEYQSILADAVRQAYKDVFNIIDPREDGQPKIVNVFRRFTPASQRERMVMFFLGMCREAGIPTLDAPRQRSAGAISDGKLMRTGKAQRGSSPRSPSVPVPSSRNSSGPGLDSNQQRPHPALQMLINALPAPGHKMPDERIDQWLEMARAALTFVYSNGNEGGGTDEESNSNGNS